MSVIVEFFIHSFEQN